MQPNYAPQYPQQPQGYPPQPAQPGYPPQHYPQQPQGYPAPQQGYPQAYAQPQYAPPAPQGPPAAPLPTGSLDSFYQQPTSGGGPSFKFQDANRQPMIGKSYAGFVARPITDADVRPQTDQSGNVRTYKDGRPKFVLVVPMQVQPGQEFPEGQAGWWVKGQARDELARAMAEAGAPVGAPEAGAFIQVTLVGTRPVPNLNPSFQFRVEYRRPEGAQQAAPVTAAPQQNAPVMSTATGQTVMHQQPVPPPVQQPMPQQAPAPQQSASVQGFNPEQQALFAKLTGQQPQG